MCRPPDIAPQLPSNHRSQSSLPRNQVYQPRSWAPQQEQWNSVDHYGLDWYDLPNPTQGQQPNCDVSNRIPPVATIGMPVNPPIEEKFANPNPYGFVGSSVSQTFNQPPSAPWNNAVKIPLQNTNLWQSSSISSQTRTSPDAPLENVAQGYPPLVYSGNTLFKQQPNLEYSDPSMAKWSTALNTPVKSEVTKSAQWITTSAGQLEIFDEDQIEESPALKNKKIKRMLSNRASAKRSRQRRQERLDELEIQSAKLHVEHAAMTRKLKDALASSRRYQDENSRLKREVELLKSELQQNGPKRIRLASDFDSEKEIAPKLLETKASVSGKSEPPSHFLPSGSDVSSDGFNRAGPYLPSNGKPSLVYDFSSFSPESNVTATVNLEAVMDTALPDLSFPIPSPDSIGNGLEDDWFVDLVDCFDEQPIVS